MSACRWSASSEAELSLEPPQAESATTRAASAPPINSLSIWASSFRSRLGGTTASGDLHILAGARLVLARRMPPGGPRGYRAPGGIRGVLAHPSSTRLWLLRRRGGGRPARASGER